MVNICQLIWRRLGTSIQMYVQMVIDIIVYLHKFLSLIIHAKCFKHVIFAKLNFLIFTIGDLLTRTIFLSGLVQKVAVIKQ